jgi:hypothetical protein
MLIYQNHTIRTSSQPVCCGARPSRHTATAQLFRRSRPGPAATRSATGPATVSERRGPDPAVDSRDRSGSLGEQSRNLGEPGMLPLYAARIEDLGSGDFLKIDCAACGHVALLTPEAVLS